MASDPHIALAGIFLICLIQRLALTWRQATKFDTWGHIYFTLAVKRQKRGPFRPIVPRIVEPGPFHYPFLAHWLIGRLPERVIVRYSRYINPVADALFVAAAGSFLLARGADPDAVLLAALLYVFTPLFFSKVAIGPRVADFTTRLYSEIALSAYFLIAIFGTGAPVAVDMAIGVILLAYIVLSSKFGTQAVFFLVAPFAAVTLSWQVGGSLVLAILLAFAISRGQFGEMLRSQYSHLAWYFRTAIAGGAFTGNRNALSTLFDWKPERSLKGNLVQTVFNVVGRNAFTGTLIKAPILPAIAICWISGMDGGFPVGAGPDLLALFAVAVAVFFLINLRHLLFLGEAERYIIHVAPLVAYLGAGMLLQGGAGTVALVLIAYGALYWAAEIVLLGVLRLYGGDDGIENRLIAVLRDLPRPTTVLSYPLHVLPPSRIMIETPHRPISPLQARGPGTRRLRELAPYPHADLTQLAEMVRLYDVGAVVIRERDLQERMPDFEPDSAIWSVQRVGEGPDSALCLLRRDVAGPDAEGGAGP